MRESVFRDGASHRRAEPRSPHLNHWQRKS